LGPNGAGKTTAFRILYGLMRPDAGSVRVDGLDIATDRAAAQSRLGALPDTHGLYPRLSARENILYFAHLQGVSRPEARRRVETYVPVLDMIEIIDRRTEGFSHGERTKTALARALIHQPQNIILDEPTNGLDVMSVRALREMIRRLRGEGRCVLFSSHVMQEVSALCDRIVVISNGRSVASGTPDQVREQAGCEDLEDAFVELTGSKAERV
jgi:sodium transport system ATP-binding protein